MKKSKAETARTHRRIVETAAAEFRRNRIQATTGVNELMEATPAAVPMDIASPRTSSRSGPSTERSLVGSRRRTRHRPRCPKLSSNCSARFILTAHSYAVTNRLVRT